jgi:ribosomal protein L24E
MAGKALNRPIVGMSPTSTGKGYWLVASDGGIFSFGDARFHRSTGNITLNKPIVGISVTPTGNGYWMVASDGGIFAFRGAKFHGSTGGRSLSAPIAGMVPNGTRYTLIGQDGQLYPFA